jgi:hypothetical protein
MFPVGTRTMGNLNVICCKENQVRQRSGPGAVVKHAGGAAEHGLLAPGRIGESQSGREVVVVVKIILGARGPPAPETD